MNTSDQQENKNKTTKKNQLIFVLSSFAAIVAVGLVGYYVLGSLKNQKSYEGISQEQFEGHAETSSQLQVECQTSASKLTQLTKIDDIEAEYRKNAENCKDVYFAIESDSKFRKEGMYADLVVDIAKEISKEDKKRAVELLTFARQIKAWDFYLGPVSCDSQHVLDAYIESYQYDQKTCIKPDEIKNKIAQEILNKNFNFLDQLSSMNEVVWVGVPESDVGCPEKISFLKQTLTKMISTGKISLENQENPSSNTSEIGSGITLNFKISDKDNIAFIFNKENECVKLNSVLIPNSETSE